MPYLEADSPDLNFMAPEPLNSLSMKAATMKVWRLPSGRWLGLAIGQADREFPVELLAAVGRDSVLPD